MTRSDDIKNAYFEWIYYLVCGERYPKEISYRKLLMRLHTIPFVAIIPRDENRATDGIDLRYRYTYVREGIEDAETYLDGPCSVLEMMVALAIHCEEEMEDPKKGDRTAQWFWEMVTSLGLGAMTDDRYDRSIVDAVIMRFLNREYEPNGRGGLFTIKNCKHDLRDAEIWYQMSWYMDKFV